MKSFLLSLSSLAVVSGFAAGPAGLPKTTTIPSSSLRGEYVEARTADVYTGPCFANSEFGLVGNLAVFGWRIEEGSFQGVALNGLSVLAAVKASSTLGNDAAPVYPAKAVLIVDERATPEQRAALRGFAQKMAGDLLQDIVRVAVQPISFEIADNNVHNAQATLKAGDMVALVTRAIRESDHICHNEEAWYTPLNKVDHAMPATTIAHSYKGQGLGTTWSSPDKRSAYVATFHYKD